MNHYNPIGAFIEMAQANEYSLKHTMDSYEALWLLEYYHLEHLSNLSASSERWWLGAIVALIKWSHK